MNRIDSAGVEITGHENAMEERDLVFRAQQGDHEAFTVLARTYRDALIQLACGFLHDKEEALDVVQDVFLKAFRKLGSFKNESSLYTWLYRIAINQCKDRLRRKQRRPTVSLEELGNEGQVYEIPDPGASPEAVLEGSERERRVRAAIDSLPDKHKKVLLLRELGEMSYKDIAAVLRCREGTVMSRLFHARKMLAERLNSLIEE
ncbi:MAG: RNA polymerase sigma factor [bacterium]